VKVYVVRKKSQQHARPNGGELTPRNRRLFLGSMLRAFGHHYRRGKPVLRKDLRRLLALADDATGQGGRQ
jgi:hypothetical protein